ncbi:MAG: helix-turn-helix domain-containing protein [Planctomycetes bacterium]|nr:helix-turn-helix domain-containing protein [Planctomycetota bacterium]
MGRKPRRAIATAKRREQVADLYLQGWTQMAIAAHLSIAQSTVCTDLQAIQTHWRESGIRDFDLTREIELRKLDRLERETWEAWVRSQQPAQSARIRDDAPGRRAEKTVKNRYGDPRFLDQIHKCIAQRRALLGLDAPVRVVDATPPPALFDEERRDRIMKLAAVLQARADAAQQHDRGASVLTAEARHIEADRTAPPGEGAG